MLFMGMIPTAAAQDAAPEKAKNEVTGPGAYTYPPHEQMGQRPPVCIKPWDHGQCALFDNVICGNALFDDPPVHGPGRSS